MKTFVFIIFILFQISFINSNAQHSNQIILSDQESASKMAKGGGGFYATNPVYDGVEGTPYLFEQKKSKVYKGGKALTKEYLISYDASKNIILIQDTKQVFELDHNQMDSLIFDDRKFIFYKDGYYESLYEGEFPFLKQYTATLQKPTYNAALNTGSQVSEWKMKDSYFLVVQGVPTKISLNGKSVSRALAEQKSFVEFADNKKIKVSEEADVITILTLISSSK